MNQVAIVLSEQNTDSGTESLGEVFGGKKMHVDAPLLFSVSYFASSHLEGGMDSDDPWEISPVEGTSLLRQT